MWIFNFVIAALLLWQWNNYSFIRESKASTIVTWVLIVANILIGVLAILI